MADVCEDETDTIIGELAFMNDFVFTVEEEKEEGESRNARKNESAPNSNEISPRDKDENNFTPLYFSDFVSDEDEKEERRSTGFFSLSPDSCKSKNADELILEELAESDFIQHRQFAARRILEFLHQAGSDKERIDSVISVMCKLSEDEEDLVRCELMDQIPAIALFCKESSADLESVIRQQLVPYTVKLLSDSQIQVRKVGHSCLFVLLENSLIDSSQLSEWICPLLSQFVLTGSNPVELRAEDIAIMSKISPLVGKDMTIKFFLEPFILACLGSVGIRKVCLYHMSYFCRAIGQELTESTVLLAFMNLCNDDSRDVRKACLEVFVDIATAVSLKTRRETLSDALVNLLSDVWSDVAVAAYNILGSFISTFADPSKTRVCYSGGSWINSGGNQSPSKVEEVDRLNGGDNDCDSADLNAANTLNEVESVGRKKSNKYVATNMSFCNKFMHFKNKVSSIDSEECEKLNKKHNDRTVHGETLLNNNLTYSYETSITRPTQDCLDNENMYNNFQYWKDPLPEVEIDLWWNDAQLNARNGYLDAEANNTVSGNLQEYFQDSQSNLSETSQCSETAEEPIIREPSSEEDHPAPVLFFAEDCPTLVQYNNADEIVQRRYRDCAAYRDCAWKIINQRKPLLKMNLYSRPGIDGEEDFSGKQQVTVSMEEISSQDIVPSSVLWSYLNYTEVLHGKSFCLETDGEEVCAHSFPAVVYTLGQQHWPIVRKTFAALTIVNEHRVRRTVASSLHELAVILNEDAISRDLLPVFYTFLCDVEEVRMKTMQHSADFLKHLKADERQTFLHLVGNFLEDVCENNWRYRCTLAEQLLPSVQLFSACDVHNFFLPVALKLLEDKVSVVRLAAAKLTAGILKSVSSDEKMACHVKSCLELLEKTFLKASKWLKRQMYVNVCEELAKQRSLSEDTFMDVALNLLSLAWDSVPNVRLAVSRCLAMTLISLRYIPIIERCHRQLLLQVLYSLRSDIERDVRHFAHMATEALPSLRDTMTPPRRSEDSLPSQKESQDRRCRN